MKEHLSSPNIQKKIKSHIIIVFFYEVIVWVYHISTICVPAILTLAHFSTLQIPILFTFTSICCAAGFATADSYLYYCSVTLQRTEAITLILLALFPFPDFTSCRSKIILTSSNLNASFFIAYKMLMRIQHSFQQIPILCQFYLQQPSHDNFSAIRLFLLLCISFLWYKLSQFLCNN